jgi:hypothetical protein
MVNATHSAFPAGYNTSSRTSLQVTRFPRRPDFLYNYFALDKTIMPFSPAIQGNTVNVQQTVMYVLSEKSLWFFLPQLSLVILSFKER